MAKNIYDIDQALANIKSPVYSSGQAASLLTALDPDGIGRGLSQTGTAIQGIGTDLQKYATDQAAAQLAAQSRAGMQIDPLTGQPIDPTGQGVAELMAQARTAQQNVDPLLLDRIEPIPAIKDPVTGKITQQVVPGRSAGFNPNFDLSNLSGMVNLKTLSDRADALGKDRRDAAAEFRKVAKEKRDAAEAEFQRSMDDDKRKIEKLKGIAAQQSININKWKEEDRQIQAKIQQGLDGEKLFEAQKRSKVLQQKIMYELENQRQTNLGLVSTRKHQDALTTSQPFLDEATKVKTALEREKVTELKAKNQTAARKEKDRKAMAAQFEAIDIAEKKDAQAIIAAQAKGEVAPESDFYQSNTFKAFNKASKSNRANTRENKLLQENFAQLLREQDLPITDEQLIKAGVAKVNEKGEIVSYDYAPAAQKKLDRILSSALQQNLDQEIVHLQLF